MKNLKLLGLLLFAIFINACNSDNETVCGDHVGELTADETPLVGTWRMTAIVSDKEVDITDDSEDNAGTDIYAQYTDCQKDAEYTFTTARGYTFKQGFTAIGCTDKSDNSGTWKIANNQILFASNCAQFSLPITLDANKTVFTFESNVTILDVNNISVPVKLTVTYTKI